MGLIGKIAGGKPIGTSVPVIHQTRKSKHSNQCVVAVVRSQCMLRPLALQSSRKFSWSATKFGLNQRSS